MGLIILLSAAFVFVGGVAAVAAGWWWLALPCGVVVGASSTLALTARYSESLSPLDLTDAAIVGWLRWRFGRREKKSTPPSAP